VRGLEGDAIDFSMDTQPFKASPPQEQMVARALIADLLIYYGVLLAAMSLVWWLIR
jgi:hypothetical protein